MGLQPSFYGAATRFAQGGNANRSACVGACAAPVGSRHAAGDTRHARACRHLLKYCVLATIYYILRTTI